MAERRRERMRARLRACAAPLLAALLCVAAPARGEEEPGQSDAQATPGPAHPADRPAAARDPRLGPEAILPGLDPDAPMAVEEARALRDVVRIAREDAEDAFVRERIACYGRFLINRCLADVRVRERLVRARLDRIEVAVNRRLREADAYALSLRQAEAIAERQRRAEEETSRREENVRAFEARAASAEAERAQREAEAPELERRGAANRAERERREAENAARRQEAAQRAAGDAGRAQARQVELESRAREARAREEKEAAQRERRSEEAARREADARRREVERERREAERERRPGRSGDAQGTVPGAPAR